MQTNQSVNTINYAFQFAEILANYAFPNRSMYNLFCTGTYLQALHFRYNRSSQINFTKGKNAPTYGFCEEK